MDFSLTYLFYRFFYRFGDFFRHWFLDGTKFFGHQYISILEGLDKTLAIRITLKYLFQPLYKDYTLLGRILGFFFRSGRIAVAALIYAVTIVFMLAIYSIWLAIPLFVLSQIFFNLYYGVF